MTALTKLLLIVVLSAAGVVLSHETASAKSCTISTATIAFGSYSVYGAAFSGTGSIQGTCSGSGSISPVLALNAGANGTISARAMLWSSCVNAGCATSTDKLQYNLYTTSAHTTIWGDGTTGSTVVPALTGGSFNTPVFGLIPMAVAGSTNDVSAGNYADTVLVTLTY